MLPTPMEHCVPQNGTYFDSFFWRSLASFGIGSPYVQVEGNMRTARTLNN